MAEGYKGFFKVILAILEFLQDDLIGKSFEENLVLLGKLTESELFKNNKFE